MERRVEALRRVVRGDPWPAVERFIDDPSGWLPRPAHAVGRGRWRTNVRVGWVGHDVVAEVGVARSLPAGWIRELRWAPASGSGADGHETWYLPVFAGEILLHQPDPDVLDVVVAGTYEPPFGAVGAVFDVLALHRAAEATVGGFAEDVLARVAVRTRSEARGAS